ncbi:uncharacterized protein HLK63_F07535 [Nakaseomyces glabratus]|nr:uncharacterized protein GW608_F07535 [Nakaseomyces glabratus]UCS25517.1 uncharacterized protein HLK63_F07535 [Nakaseomyces glabratus]UCS30747.1 uncharacterized protein HLK64_F07535 [Nakaseomyces glabratus]UCS35976.1 uncharacterized protein HLK62_F07535 [Nakaseomyces glabratus]
MTSFLFRRLTRRKKNKDPKEKNKEKSNRSNLRISKVPPPAEKYPTPPRAKNQYVIPAITDDPAVLNSPSTSVRIPRAPMFADIDYDNITERKAKRLSRTDRSVRYSHRHSSRRISMLISKLEEDKKKTVSLDSSDINVRYSFRDSALSRLQEVLDEANESPWGRTRLMSSPLPRYRHIASTYATPDNRIFVMGGLHGELVYGDTWMLTANSDSTNFTTQVIDLTVNTPPPRVGHAATLCGNALVIFGGDTHKLNSEGLLDDDLYLFNVDSHRWTIPTPIGTRPLGRYGHQISVIATTPKKAKLYLFGGQLDDNYFNDLAMYDLSDFRNPHSRWQFLKSKAFTPPPLTNHTMVAYDYKLWVFGGSSRGELQNQLYVYIPDLNEWRCLETEGDKPQPIQEHSATIYKNLMCVFGGKNKDDEYQNTMYFLNLQTLKWYRLDTSHCNEPLPRSGQSMSLMQNDKILIMGGDKNDYCVNGANLNDIDEYDRGYGVASYTLDLKNLNDYCPGVFSIERPANLTHVAKNPEARYSMASPGPNILTPYLQQVRQLNRLLSTASMSPKTPSPMISKALPESSEKEDISKDQAENTSGSTQSPPAGLLGTSEAPQSGRSENESVFENAFPASHLSESSSPQQSEISIVENKKQNNPFITNPLGTINSSIIELNKANTSQLPIEGTRSVILSQDTVEQLQQDLEELRIMEESNETVSDNKLKQLKMEIDNLRNKDVVEDTTKSTLDDLNEKFKRLEQGKDALRSKMSKLDSMFENNEHHKATEHTGYALLNLNSKASRNKDTDLDDSNQHLVSIDAEKVADELLLIGDKREDSSASDKSESFTLTESNQPETSNGDFIYNDANKNGKTSLERKTVPRKMPVDKKRVKRRTILFHSQKHKEMMEELTKQLDMLTYDSQEMASSEIDSNSSYKLENQMPVMPGNFPQTM